MTLHESLAGLPAFLLYFASALALLAVFLALYLAGRRRTRSWR